MSSILFSIGHGSRKINEFIGLLKSVNIQYLVDVRSYPQSRFHPQFNQKALEQSLHQACISYVFMGDTLGGRPKDQSCYTNGQVDYTILQTKDFYQEGIKRLKIACEKELPVAIMCSERNPCDCHRSRLIGQTLSKEGVSLLHIDESGQLADQTTVMNRLKRPEGLF